MNFSSIPAYLDPSNWQQVRVPSFLFLFLFLFSLDFFFFSFASKAKKTMEPPREKDKYSPILLSIYLLLLFLNILEIFDFIPLQIILLISKSPIKWEAVVALELVLSFYHRRCRRLHRLLPHHPMASAVPVRSALVRWPSELEWLIFRCPRQH